MKKLFLGITAVAVGFVFAVALCLRVLNEQTVSVFSDGNMRIVVDAGHGGIDGGVAGKTTGIQESDLNLEIAMRLKEKLEEVGFEVFLTRKTEAGLYDTTAKGFKKRDMQKRKEIIERVAPALVVSVHQNYYPAKGTRGGQVFYSAKKEESQRLALCTQNKLNELYAKEGGKGRKAAKGEYFMLECAPCPSIIVECGFLSNPEDERLLQQKAWQSKIAGAIVASVVEFFGRAVS